MAQSSTTSYRRVSNASTVSSRAGPGGSLRLRREDWFMVAFDLLAAEGVDALTIANMCRRLRVTKGSFYHHFAAMPQFVDALLRHWEDEFASVLDELAGLSDPIRRFELTSEQVYAMPHDAEAALRAWGYRNPVVAAAVARMDRARAINYANTLALAIDDPERCRTLASMGSALLIGLQMGERPVDRERILRVGLEWARTNIGLTIQAEVDGDRVRVNVTGLPDRRSGGE